MTIPDAGKITSFAFFASGATFSRAVLDCLLAADYPPDVVVLPEYPPAPRRNALLRVQPPNEFLDQASDFELLYAPYERQSSCAKQLIEREIVYLLVACWPYLIGPELRQVVRHAALNLHPSLLPRYRGPDPVAEQMSHGERNLGVTLHLLDDRFDHGDIVGQIKFESEPGRSSRAKIEKRCAKEGVELFVDALNTGRSAWRVRPQDGTSSD